MALLLLLIYAQLDGKMERNRLNNITMKSVNISCNVYLLLSMCCLCVVYVYYIYIMFCVAYFQNFPPPNLHIV